MSLIAAMRLFKVLVFIAPLTSCNPSAKKEPAPSLRSTRPTSQTSSTRAAFKEASAPSVRKEYAKRPVWPANKKPKFTPLGHSSFTIHINGWSLEEVIAVFGEPIEVHASAASFKNPVYRLPRNIPFADLQYVYPYGMSHILIWFKKQTVVLAIDERSDF